MSNGHDWVDLGLSVKWATCNVGALNPEDYGDYFAWGETRPKSEYTLSNLKYCNEGDNIHNVKFSKYVTTGQYGPVDNRIILETSDDAASANWGGNWRMPTNEEFKELINNCIWTWTNIKGRKGYKVSSKANDCFIFLPIGSFFSDKTCNLIYPLCVNGYYWSSTLSKNGSDAARFLYINSTYRFTDEISRDTGLSVRPVFD